ncbi:unnamed protein product [Ectocarpus sp. 13 AM-2016]
MLESATSFPPALAGGPETNESLRAWKTRLQSRLAEQKRAEQERAKQQRAEQSRAEEHARLERGGTNAAPDGRSSSSGNRDAEHVFRVQVASFAELDSLTRENHETLEEVKRLIRKPANSCPRGTESTDTDKLRELDRLVAMAKALDEMASRHLEHKSIQQKELTLPPGSKAYFTLVRTGLCNAYLAASVVDSSLVRTSKSGGMCMVSAEV